MPALTNLRQETFCQEYLKDRNASRAYKAAGYSCKNGNVQAAGSCQLLKSFKVKARILELEQERRKALDKQQERLEEKAAINRAWVINRLVENVDRSMQAVPVVDQFGNPTGVYKYRGDVANTALGLIGKDLGMFAEKSALDGLFAGAAVQVNLYLPEKRRDPHLIGNGSADH